MYTNVTIFGQHYFHNVDLSDSEGQHYENNVDRKWSPLWHNADVNFFGRYAFSNNALANNVDQNISEEMIECFKPLFAILQSKWDGPGETLQDNTNWIRSYIFLIYYLQYIIYSMDHTVWLHNGFKFLKLNHFKVII